MQYMENMGVLKQEQEIPLQLLYQLLEISSDFYNFFIKIRIGFLTQILILRKQTSTKYRRILTDRHYQFGTPMLDSQDRRVRMQQPGN